MRARLPRTLLPAIFACCLLPASAQEKPPVPETKYEVIVPGMVANSPFTLTFQSVGLRLEVRDLIMGRGVASDIPTPNRAVMELRGGNVITTINDERIVRVQGDIWRISPGDRLTIENPYDVAVIRAMAIFDGGRR